MQTSAVHTYVGANRIVRLGMLYTCVYLGTVFLEEKWDMRVVSKGMGTEVTAGTVGCCPLPQTRRPDDGDYTYTTVTRSAFSLTSRVIAAH